MENSEITEMGFEAYAAMWGCDPAYTRTPQLPGDGYLFCYFSAGEPNLAFLQMFLPAIQRTIAMCEQEKRPEDARELKFLAEEVRRRINAQIEEALVDDIKISVLLTRRELLLLRLALGEIRDSYEILNAEFEDSDEKNLSIAGHKTPPLNIDEIDAVTAKVDRGIVGVTSNKSLRPTNG